MAKSDKAVPTSMAPGRSINLKRVQNGYIVSKYDNKVGEDVSYVAKDAQEVAVHMKKLMGK